MLYDLSGFNWLLAELDTNDNIAFSWASLNDDQSAEWGYIYLPDVESTGAFRDENWIPLYFPEAKKVCYGYLEDAGTKAHFDWWRHHQNFRKQEHSRVAKKIAYQSYVEHIYKNQFGLVT